MKHQNYIFICSYLQKRALVPVLREWSLAFVCENVPYYILTVSLCI